MSRLAWVSFRPRNVMPQNISASITGGAGYYWFGNQSAEFGGFPPAGIFQLERGGDADAQYL